MADEQHVFAGDQGREDGVDLVVALDQRGGEFPAGGRELRMDQIGGGMQILHSKNSVEGWHKNDCDAAQTHQVRAGSAASVYPKANVDAPIYSDANQPFILLSRIDDVRLYFR